MIHTTSTIYIRIHKNWYQYHNNTVIIIYKRRKCCWLCKLLSFVDITINPLDMQIALYLNYYIYQYTHKYMQICYILIHLSIYLLLSLVDTVLIYSFRYAILLIFTWYICQFIHWISKFAWSLIDTLINIFYMQNWFISIYR